MGRRIAAVDPAYVIHAWRGPGSGHIGQGHNIQGTPCSRGATSKNFRSGTHRSGTHQPCIVFGERPLHFQATVQQHAHAFWISISSTFLYDIFINVFHLSQVFSISLSLLDSHRFYLSLFCTSLYFLILLDPIPSAFIYSFILTGFPYLLYLFPFLYLSWRTMSSISFSSFFLPRFPSLLPFLFHFFSWIFSFPCPRLPEKTGSCLNSWLIKRIFLPSYS
jgi:hypothetical protein